MDENLAQVRHEQSEKDFPFLNLNDGEYVEYAFSRAKICLTLILGGLALGLILVLMGFLAVVLSQDRLDDMGRNFTYIILATLLAATFIIVIFATMIYRGNRLFVTNKRVIQFIMTSPFARSVNMIDLPSIEDASFTQSGFLQTMFHYGTFRLSTVGDETTYTFNYSDVAPSELKAVSKLITNAKLRRAKKTRKGEGEVAEIEAEEENEEEVVAKKAETKEAESNNEGEKETKNEKEQAEATGKKSKKNK